MSRRQKRATPSALPVGPRRVTPVDGDNNPVLLGRLLDDPDYHDELPVVGGQVVLCLGLPVVSGDKVGLPSHVENAVMVTSIKGEVGWLYLEELEPLEDVSC